MSNSCKIWGYMTSAASRVDCNKQPPCVLQDGQLWTITVEYTFVYKVGSGQDRLI